MAEIDAKKHVLVPKHSKISEKEKKELCEKYGVSLRDLPRVIMSESSIQGLDVKEGDVIKIVRRSPTAGESVFYRRVVAHA